MSTPGLTKSYAWHDGKRYTERRGRKDNSSVVLYANVYEWIAERTMEWVSPVGHSTNQGYSVNSDVRVPVYPGTRMHYRSQINWVGLGRCK